MSVLGPKQVRLVLQGLPGHRQAAGQTQGDRPVPRAQSAPSPSASTAGTCSTATRTAWRSASDASCAPGSARPGASTCEGRTTRPTPRCHPGERYGFVYEINFLRCIHCDLCVEACPTEAITESKLFEFSFTNRDDAIYTKAELVVDDDGPAQGAALGGLEAGRRPQHLGLGAGHVAGGPGRPRRRAPVVGGARLRRTPSPGGPVRPEAADVPADFDISVREVGAAELKGVGVSTVTAGQAARCRRPAPGRRRGEPARRDRIWPTLRPGPFTPSAPSWSSPGRPASSCSATPCTAPWRWSRPSSASRCCSSTRARTSWPPCRSSSTPVPS